MTTNSDKSWWVQLLVKGGTAGVLIVGILGYACYFAYPESQDRRAESKVFREQATSIGEGVRSMSTTVVEVMSVIRQQSDRTAETMKYLQAAQASDSEKLALLKAAQTIHDQQLRDHAEQLSDHRAMMNVLKARPNGSGG